ncbi:hypothetical protein V8C43DRAFT_284157 [Trichoderma afarasin]
MQQGPCELAPRDQCNALCHHRPSNLQPQHPSIQVYTVSRGLNDGWMALMNSSPTAPPELKPGTSSANLAFSPSLTLTACWWPYRESARPPQANPPIHHEMPTRKHWPHK